MNYRQQGILIENSFPYSYNYSGESNINQKEDDFKPLIRSVSEFKFWFILY